MPLKTNKKEKLQKNFKDLSREELKFMVKEDIKRINKAVKETEKKISILEKMK